MRRTRLALAGWIALMGSAGVPLAAGTPKTDYDRLVARERVLAAQGPAAPRLVRRMVADYDLFARRHGQTGYADNALWNAGRLAASLYGRTGQGQDREAAVKLFTRLVKSYPTSSLAAEARVRLRELTAPASARRAPPREPETRTAASITPPVAPRPTAIDPASGDAPIASRDLPPPAAEAPSRGARNAEVAAATPVRLLGVRRSVTGDAVRVTIELDGETSVHEERLEAPPRVYFDLQNATATSALQDRILSYSDDIVRQVRVGRRPDNAVRVAMDLDGVRRYSVFPLYNPFRLVIDFERDQPPATAAAAAAPPWVAPLPAQTLSAGLERAPAVTPEAPAPAAATVGPAAPLPARSTAPPLTLPPPSAPAANSTGSFSMARQLGLGISRIVIDPGHGGHDPGAQGARLSEADLVLDVALRLEKLLLAQPGVEVVLTRRDDTFVALEERTAIANRERADLFLSIHANASRNRKARGVETYFLNFANTPEAAAVAARENSASGRTMHNLPDMVRAIALNNKLDESRDFARLVQDAMVRRLGPQAGTRDLGVKQAPFVVLIGAQMPSVLAEISFVTHPSEAALLRAGAHRQKIAEALSEAIGKYQRALKRTTTVAGQ
jgi:N-acetylmuramoyl-L-alanine amidase